MRLISCALRSSLSAESAAAAAARLIEAASTALTAVTSATSATLLADADIQSGVPLRPIFPTALGSIVGMLARPIMRLHSLACRTSSTLSQPHVRRLPL